MSSSHQDPTSARPPGHLSGLNVRERLGAVYRSGLPHLLLSIGSVQGLTHASQVFLAKLVGPEEFGVVRTGEALIGVLVVIGSVGMPTLAVQSVAAASDEARGRLLGRLVALAVAGGFVTSLAVSAAAGLVFPDPTRTYLRTLVWVIVLTGASRVCLGYFQGVRRIQGASVLTSALSAVSLPALLYGGWRWGLHGWLACRYLTEALLAAALLASVGPVIAFRGHLSSALSTTKLLGLGLPVATSLLLRTGQDAVGLLSLNLVNAAATAIGHFGLGALCVTMLSVVPGAVGNIILPAMVERRGSPKDSRALLLSSVRWGLWLTLPPAAAIFLTAPVLLHLALPAYAETSSLLRILVLIAPCRAVVAMAGCCLLAHLNVRFGLWANAAALLSAFVLSLVAASRFGVLGVALVAFSTEAVVASAYLLAALRITRPPVRQPS